MNFIFSGRLSSYVLFYFRHNLVAELDPDNAGVLIVQLGGRRSGRRAIGLDEVARRLEKPGDGCVIM